jgi:hypothetical protein
MARNTYRTAVIQHIREYKKQRDIYLRLWIEGNKYRLIDQIWEMSYPLENIYNILIDNNRRGLPFTVILKKYTEICETSRRLNSD